MAKRSPAQIGRTKSAAKRVTTREFARIVGAPQPDVVKAMRTGRLARSVRTDENGRSYIADSSLAQQEWRAGAAKPAPKATSRPATVETAKNKRPAPPSARAEPTPKPTPKTLVDAQMQVSIERERQLRLANDVREGQLLEASRARREAFETARTVRDALLNIPDRVAAELAAESDASKVHARLDEEIRLALTSIAETLNAEPVAAPGEVSAEPDAHDGAAST